MYIAGIGPAVFELLSFKVISENYQRGLTLVQESVENLRQYKARFTENDITSDKSQFPIIKN